MQLLGGKVDVDDGVGLAQKPVGYALPYFDARHARDDLLDGLEVLDVDGRHDGDPGREDVLDVLIALLVLDARDVGVRELVDQHDLGLAGEDRRQVHLLERLCPCTGRCAAGSSRGRRSSRASRRGRGSR